ncbi:MAG: hypothetical protein IPK07_20195 [Deltaproteobacteria bacterium]|nr:hypothetical protein [Deltaproteobacteria bacterium]
MRAFELDFWDWNGVVSLCHGVCAIANKPAAQGLAEIKTFLDAHPDEVVTIYLDSFVSAAEAGTAFTAAGLLDEAHPGSDSLYAHPGGTWPTLAALIDSGERLLVFSNDDEEAAHPWYMFKFRHGFDTTWDTYALADFTCAIDGGSPTNALFWMNHRLSTLVGGGTPELAAQANTNPFLLEKAEQCAALYGRNPTFVHVDFYEVGDLFDTVDALNGFPVACVDGDGDGYGSPASPGCAHFDLDCDDTNGSVHPDATGSPATASTTTATRPPPVPARARSRRTPPWAALAASKAARAPRSTSASTWSPPRRSCSRGGAAAGNSRRPTERPRSSRSITLGRGTRRVPGDTTTARAPSQRRSLSEPLHLVWRARRRRAGAAREVRGTKTPALLRVRPYPMIRRSPNPPRASPRGTESSE